MKRDIIETYFEAHFDDVLNDEIVPMQFYQDYRKNILEYEEQLTKLAGGTDTEIWKLYNQITENINARNYEVIKAAYIRGAEDFGN